ncbi:MAG: CopG family transcriptional regulator [Leptospiraceae bacterium]|nr:CopG family transcriptional regulator [Leptospiraceae bacterium]
MTKIVTMRIDENLLKQFNNFAKLENRSLSNFIETATKKYINEMELTDDFETKEILENKSLLKKLANGRKDAKSKQKRFFTF